MKLEIFDRMLIEQDDVIVKNEAERVRFIVEALDSLEKIEASYVVYGEDEMPKSVIHVLDEEGVLVLPITMLDGHIVKKGHYPSNEDIMAYTGIEFEIMDEEDCHHNGGCCCGHKH